MSLATSLPPHLFFCSFPLLFKSRKEEHEKSDGDRWHVPPANVLLEVIVTVQIDLIGSVSNDSRFHCLKQQIPLTYLKKQQTIHINIVPG